MTLMNQFINEYTTLSQWENSKATRIPTSVLKLLNIDVNQIPYKENQLC